MIDYCSIATFTVVRILIVEDDIKIGENILKGLQDRGYSSTLSQTGEEGLENIMVEDYDCVVLDRKLPDIDGIEICKEVRSNAINTPIILLTAVSGVKDKVTGLEVGADDYLTKPFAMDELVARIQAIIRRSSFKSQPVIIIGDVQLNSVKRSLEVKGEEISLSNREFILIEYLMRNAGKPLTRIQIYDHVWESNIDSKSNLVDVYINYIRNKIDFDPKEPSYVETVRGYGYRFRNVD